MKKFALIIAMVLVCGSAWAASYGVNFDGQYDQFGLTFVPLPFPAVPLGPGDANQVGWNNIHAPMSVNNGPWNSSFAITDDAGGNSLTVTIGMAHAGGNDGGGDCSTNINCLYHTGMRDNDGIITLTATPSYALYDVYVYYGNNPGAGFVEGTNYSRATDVSGLMTISIGSLNGFSIVDATPTPAVPEPASLGLIALSLLAVKKRRR